MKIEKFGGVTESVNIFDLQLGAMAVAGVDFQITSRVGVLIEYRLSFFDQDVNDKGLYSSVSGDRTTHVEILTHHVFLGISIRF